MTKIRKDQGKFHNKREPLHVIRRRPEPPSPALPPRMVSPVKLKEGLEEAAKTLQAIADTVARTLEPCKAVKEVELPIGFNLEGRLVGIGTGAPVTIRVVIKIPQSS